MPSFSDYLKLHFIVFLWGTTAVIAKVISIPATEMLFYRTLLSALGMVGLLFLTNGWHKISFKDFFKLLGVGFIVGIHWMAFFVSGQLSTASISLVGFATCSLWAAILEPLVAGNRIRPIEIALGIAVLCGLYIIFHFEFNFYLGLLISVFSGFLAAVFSIMNFHLVKRIPATTISMVEMIGAFLFVTLLLPVYQLYFAQGGKLQLSPNLLDWFYLAILSLVCSVYAYSMSIKLMKKISVFTLQLTLNLEPIYGIILAILVLDEAQFLGLPFFIGTGIILLAVMSYPLLKRKLINNVA